MNTIMRIIFLAVLAIHGAIHLMGFVKGMGISNVPELKLYVSKPMGVLWLAAFLLFLTALTLLLFGNRLWWVFALSGILVSQALITLFWQDAKFGTFANILILIPALIGCAGYRFDRMVNRETVRLFSGSDRHSGNVITSDMTAGLPKPVRKWLARSGIVGREAVRTVRLKQNVRIKMKPDQKHWSDARAVQYFTVKEPAFVWKVRMNMLPVGFISGRDKFVEGRGEMLIKLLSVFPVVNARENRKLDQSALQRYLAEIMWFPAAALNPSITWEQIDEGSVKAVISYADLSGEGIFFFNPEGDVTGFEAMRFMGSDEHAELKRWTIRALRWGSFNGIRIPVAGEASWQLPEGEWVWLQLDITDIDYNIAEVY